MTSWASKAAMTGLLLLALGACSSSGAIQIQQAKTAQIPPGKTVSLQVGSVVPSDASSSQSAEFKEVEQRLKAALFGRLVSEGVFQQVLQPGQAGDYQMQVTLNNANKVSQGARILAGVLAGSNSLKAGVRLTETSTSSLVTAFEVEGTSAAHPFSTEAGLDDAVREAVDEILLALQ